MSEREGCPPDACGTLEACAGCSKNPNAKQEPQSLLAENNPYNHIKKVFAVVSGKGGVGKSMVTGLLATGLQRRGYRVAVMDADITGPSIPMMFGVHDHAEASEAGLIPQRSKGGIDLMSVNLLLESEDQPVIWRGPVISGVVKQFWTDVVWGDVDALFIDMPPGTGDVPLTVFQSLPIDGVVLVTSPQSLVGMIVKKAANMAGMMNVPVVGMVENMSYVKCPDCGNQIALFGEGRSEEAAREAGVELLDKLPLDPLLTRLSDNGTIELSDTEELIGNTLDKIEAMVKE